MTDATRIEDIEDAMELRARERYLIEKTFLPICMVNEAGEWVRSKQVGATASGRPIYRAMEGRKPAFLGFDWEAIHVECGIEDMGNGTFAVAY